MEYGDNLTYAKRVIEIYDQIYDIIPNDFTLISNTILGVLSSICPDGSFLIDINDNITLPKQNESKTRYLKN